MWFRSTLRSAALSLRRSVEHKPLGGPTWEIQTIPKSLRILQRCIRPSEISRSSIPLPPSSTRSQETQSAQPRLEVPSEAGDTIPEPTPPLQTSIRKRLSPSREERRSQRR